MSKIILGYCIIILFLSSVTKNAVWTEEKIEDIVRLEWTIFGLSIAIFLVWTVLITKYLKETKPQETEELDYLQRYELLKEKQAFSQKVDSSFSIIVLLSINLFLLLVGSTLVYIGQLTDAIFTQIVVRCTFFFSTNTIVSIFFDILKPLKAEKDTLKKTSKVSMSELDTVKAGVFISSIIYEGLKQINESSKYSQAEKKQLSTQYVEVVRDALSEIANNDSKDQSVKNTKDNEE